MMCSLFIIASSWRSESYRQTKRFRLTFYIRSSLRQLPLGHLLCPAFRIVCISYDHPFPVSLLCYYRSSWLLLLLLLLLLFSSKKNPLIAGQKECCYKITCMRPQSPLLPFYILFLTEKVPYSYTFH